MTEDQKADLILDTAEDIQTFIYALTIAAENYIKSGISINDALEQMNVEVDFERIKIHIEDLEYLFMDID